MSNEATCPICLEVMQVQSPRNRRAEHVRPAHWQIHNHAHLSPSLLYTLGCGHQFHRHCVLPWLQYKRTCPVCKAPAEMIDPPSCDSLLLGTSFQAPFSPHTPPLQSRQLDTAGFDSANPLTAMVDAEYVLTASNGSHFSQDNRSAPLSNHLHPLVNDAKSVFESMGWRM